jgi:hypothetical protein
MSGKLVKGLSEKLGTGPAEMDPIGTEAKGAVTLFAAITAFGRPKDLALRGIGLRDGLPNPQMSFSIASGCESAGRRLNQTASARKKIAQ